MKAIPLFVFFAMTIFLKSAFGSVSIDPAMEKIREEFSNAVAPNLSDLKLGKTWTCDKYIENYYSFKIKKISEALILVGKENKILNQGVILYDDFRFESTGVVGMGSGGHILELRVDRRGNLIGENISAFKRDPSDRSLLPSISKPAYEAFLYIKCPLKKYWWQ